MQPYKPKPTDPGRLIYPISFYMQETADNGSGGTTITETLSLTTKAAKIRIFEGNQLALEVGASVLNGDVYFVIRHRRGWYPEKDMVAVVEGDKYTIRAVIPVNEPVTHLKLLCVKRDG